MASPDAPKHASGDAQSQSLECDGQDHTFVWVANAPTDAPALAGPDIAGAEVTAARLTPECREPALSEQALPGILRPAFAWHCCDASSR
jgi:hypothetical protein